MLHKRNIFILSAIVALYLAGNALAGAVLQELVCLDPESDASGFAVLNYAIGSNNTNVIVQGRNLQAGEEYTVFLCDYDYVECESIGSFTALTHGEGYLYVNHPGDASDQYVAVVQGTFDIGAIYTILCSDGSVKIGNIYFPVEDFEELDLEKMINTPVR